MINAVANWVARSDRRLPNNLSVISFDLQSHRSHWILHFFGQVLNLNWINPHTLALIPVMALNVVSLLD